jgi:hypothetical protein
MAYRVIILNGDQRGERWDVGASPVLIGQHGSSGIIVKDPDVMARHAEMSTRDGSLVIRSLDESNLVLVNGTTTRESPLKHGDVLQIGTTRFFIQARDDVGAWDNLAGFRRYRHGLTIGIPVVVILVLAAVWNRFMSVPESQPPLSHPVATAPADLQISDDCLVTNTPRILIHDSVTLTSTPPDVTEAIELMAQLRTHRMKIESDVAQQELERATLFMEASSNVNRDRIAITNPSSGSIDLIKAETLLDKSGVMPH